MVRGSNGVLLGFPAAAIGILILAAAMAANGSAGLLHQAPPVVEFCPNQCSRNGICVTGICRCFRGHEGLDCSIPLHPSAESDAEKEEEAEHRWLKPLAPEIEPGRPLKVLLVSHQQFSHPVYDDVDVVIPGAALATALAQDGHAVTLLFFVSRPEILNETRRKEFAHQLRQKRVELTVIDNTRHHYMLSLASFSHEAWQWIKEHMESEATTKPFDVIHFNDGHGCGYYTLLAKAQMVPVGGSPEGLSNTVILSSITLPHLMHVQSSDKGRVSTTDNLEIGFMEREAARLSDAVFIGGRSVANWIKERQWNIPGTLRYAPGILPLSKLPNMGGLANDHPFLLHDNDDNGDDEVDDESCSADIVEGGSFGGKDSKLIFLIEGNDGNEIGYGMSAGTDRNQYIKSSQKRNENATLTDTFLAASLAESLDSEDFWVGQSAMPVVIFIFLGDGGNTEETNALTERAKKWRFPWRIMRGFHTSVYRFLAQERKNSKSVVMQFARRIRGPSTIELTRYIASAIHPHRGEEGGEGGEEESRARLIVMTTRRADSLFTEVVSGAHFVTEAEESLAVADALEFLRSKPLTLKRKLDERTLHSSLVAWYRQLAASTRHALHFSESYDVELTDKLVAMHATQSSNSSSSNSIMRKQWQPTKMVSVIMTHYNRPHFLIQAVQSLVDQSYPSHLYEFVIVDDGSTDVAVPGALSDLEMHFNFAQRGWRILRGTNRYLGGARNYGVEEARGDYILFVDDDNYAKPNEIEVFARAMDSTGADVLTCHCDFVQGELAPLPPQNSQEISTYRTAVPFEGFVFLGGSVELGLFKNTYGDANSFFRKSALVELGGFTEDRKIGYEDWELYNRAALAGYNIAIVPEGLFWYRFTAGSMQKTTLYSSSRRRALRPYIHYLHHHPVTS